MNDHIACFPIYKPELETIYRETSHVGRVNEEKGEFEYNHHIGVREQGWMQLQKIISKIGLLYTRCVAFLKGMICKVILAIISKEVTHNMTMVERNKLL